MQKPQLNSVPTSLLVKSDIKVNKALFKIELINIATLVMHKPKPT